MKTKEVEKKKKQMNPPRIVSPKEWEAARQQLLVKEKELTHARDALAAERRRMPWLAVEKKYEFDGPKSKASLLDLFDGRRPGRSSRSSERPRYYTRVRLSRAADGYRAPKGTNGLAVHSLVHDHGRLRQGLRRG